ncbi:hypothetical protein BCR44DRAFT_1467977 [Catenaria anguillulae PL171]|uniref:Uncharacterized protein n=1 Tax=Catenaria anguillulae PL171 TaxID=765915 RepID=A0A1Y2H3T4_9FUNG|nr:hypothetical protein BCR44DRAFT_1467977 [Catenaria anguillulae PL171]
MANVSWRSRLLNLERVQIDPRATRVTPTAISQFADIVLAGPSVRGGGGGADSGVPGTTAGDVAASDTIRCGESAHSASAETPTRSPLENRTSELASLHNGGLEKALTDADLTDTKANFWCPLFEWTSQSPEAHSAATVTSRSVAPVAVRMTLLSRHTASIPSTNPNGQEPMTTCSIDPWGTRQTMTRAPLVKKTCPNPPVRCAMQSYWAASATAGAAPTTVAQGRVQLANVSMAQRTCQRPDVERQAKARLIRRLQTRWPIQQSRRRNAEWQWFGT